MQADVFTRFHVTLNDHFSAFVKGIYLSLPDGVSSQRLKWDLSNRFREVFPLRYIYDPLNGLCKLQTGKENLAPEHRTGSTGEQVDLLTLLNRVGRKIEENTQRLLVLLDGVDGYLNDDLVVLRLSEILGRERFGYTLLFLGFGEFPRYNPLPRLNLHEVPYPTPCRESLRALVRTALAGIVMERRGKLDLEGLEIRLADALFGSPSLALAEDLLSLACPADGVPSPAAIEALKLGKVGSQVPGLSIRSPQDLPAMEEVAGFAHLKSYCEARRGIFLQQGKEEGPLRLRGICLLGPPGTGKSRFAQALARSWKVLYCGLSLTFMSKFFGESERNLERIFRMLTDFGGPVLFHLDELSRLFGGNQGETHEVTRRILAMLLTFLESPDSRNVYTVGTMNHLDVDPALFRGFDEAFYVGLPDEGERRALLQGLLRRFGIELPVDGTVVTASQGLVGAEMERVVADLAVEGRRRGMAPSPLELIRILRDRPHLAELFPEIAGMEERAARAGFRLASPREGRAPAQRRRGRR